MRRSEIWLVNLDPTVGAEIRKTRPVAIVSSDAVGVLPVKLVAPLTEWKTHNTTKAWHVKITPDAANKLTKISGVDTLQLRCVDAQRFVQKIGQMSPLTMRQITAAIALVVEYESDLKGGD